MTRETTNQTEIKKPVPTYFPVGFAIGQSDKTVIVINFFDNEVLNGPDSLVVSHSIAMSKDRAKDLIEALQRITAK